MLQLNAAGAFLPVKTSISGVQTAHLSQIDGDCDAHEVRAIFIASQFTSETLLDQAAQIIRSVAPGDYDVAPADIDTVRRVSQAVTRRAARLTAAGIAAVIGRSSWCAPAPAPTLQPALRVVHAGGA